MDEMATGVRLEDKESRINLTRTESLSAGLEIQLRMRSGKGEDREAERESRREKLEIEQRQRLRETTGGAQQVWKGASARKTGGRARAGPSTPRATGRERE